MAQARPSSRRRVVRRLLLACLIVSAALVWPASQAGRALVVERAVAAPDAIMMLASHEWERLPAAAALARRHPAAVVLLTEPQTITIYNCHRCRERVEWLEREGVAPSRVRVLTGPADNTHGEALAARAFVARHPMARLAVVTSPYHTRRALATFAAVFAGTGTEVGVVAADPAQGRPGRWWGDPYDRHYVRYEWAAILYYRFKHGVPLTPPI